ncbi:MAG: hypothetical protein K1000chlam2_00725 [Chlamydiae bacterium]|nr:hypothetical protein [Chlamydiota bacterium]
MKKSLSLIFLIFCLFMAYPIIGQAAKKAKILLGSPVRQKPAILEEFLASLDRLEQKNYSLDYYFIDDNDSPISKKLLQDFSDKKKEKCAIYHPDRSHTKSYNCDECSHHWSETNVWKVAAFKDQMIQYAREQGYDFLFLIDSDLVLHPRTVDQLIRAKKDIVANIFWTQWQSNQVFLPSAWLMDQYVQCDLKREEKISGEEAKNRAFTFLDQLKKPGVHEVGGLCGCTLINKSSLKKEISFKEIKNVTLWGEDRHFCIRAAALGLSLHIDTHYPAYHIYRESELAGVEAFKRQCQFGTPKLTLAMIVKNEADRYLERVLESVRPFINEAVIIDDASTDNTVAVCQKLLKDIPLHLVINSESKVSNEISLRKQLWEETVKTDPDWILILNADEIFEDKIKDQITGMIHNPCVQAYFFRLYDFWNTTHYREDDIWKPNENYAPFLVRYHPGIQYQWKETPQHCGRFPQTIFQFQKELSPLRIKHYGWAKPEDRRAKYKRYQKLDPEAQYGDKNQYDSILDETPHLVAWEE